jgi:ABC-type nitrate/sulfonate/bicarbonate transport system substrate-binding protein
MVVKRLIIVCISITFIPITLFPFDMVSGMPKVRLGYLQSDLHQLPLFVALEKGFFFMEGMDVIIEGVFKAGPEEMTTFASGALDVGYLGAAPAVVAVGNIVADVKIIAQVNLEGSAIVIRKERKKERKINSSWLDKAVNSGSLPLSFERNPRNSKTICPR